MGYTGLYGYMGGVCAQNGHGIKAKEKAPNQLRKGAMVGFKLLIFASVDPWDHHEGVVSDQSASNGPKCIAYQQVSKTIHDLSAIASIRSTASRPSSIVGAMVSFLLALTASAARSLNSLAIA